MTLEIGRRLIGGRWRTGIASEGGSSAPVLVTFSCGVPGSESNPIVPIVLDVSSQDGATTKMRATATSWPMLVGAGGFIGNLVVNAPALPAGGTLSVNYAELAVANMTVTERLIAASTLGGDVIASAGSTTIALPGTRAAVGSDLSAADDGIYSTAGGVYALQAAVALVWTPA